MLEIILAWTMSCTQYDEAIKNLYRDEYFARPENLQHRSSLHEFFRAHRRQAATGSEAFAALAALASSALVSMALTRDLA